MKKTSASILDLDTVPVVLTYEDLVGPGKTITASFEFGLETSDDEIKERQVFLGLTEAERKEKLPEWKAKRLSLLLTKAPEIIIYERTKAGKNEIAREDIKGDAIFEYFNSPNAFKRKLVSDALIQYEAVSMPREFFRSV